jgi:UDP-N-acetylmuramoylalanine--D-glutamate ligase
MNYIQKISSILIHKKILILGFGKEGRSSFTFLASLSAPFSITISDAYDGNRDEVEELVGENAKCILGVDYLKNIDEYDIILKSPGLRLSLL